MSKMQDHPNHVSVPADVRMPFSNTLDHRPLKQQPLEPALAVATVQGVVFYDKASAPDDYGTHKAIPKLQMGMNKAIPKLEMDKVRERQEKKRKKRERTEERKMSSTGDDYNFKTLTMQQDAIS